MRFSWSRMGRRGGIFSMSVRVGLGWAWVVIGGGVCEGAGKEAGVEELVFPLSTLRGGFLFSLISLIF